MRIGKQTCRMLEYTPARLEIVESVRLTYRCEGRSRGTGCGCCQWHSNNPHPR